MGWTPVDVTVAGSANQARGNANIRFPSTTILIKYYIPAQSTVVSGQTDMILNEILGDEAYSLLLTLNNSAIPVIKPIKVLDYDATGTVLTTSTFPFVTGVNVDVAQAAAAGTVRVWLLVQFAKPF